MTVYTPYVHLIRHPAQCLPVYGVTPSPTTTDEIVTAIVAVYERHEHYLRDGGCAGHDAARRLTTVGSRASANRAASDILGPMMGEVWHWRVSALHGESIRAFARRVARCAAARCAVVGVRAPSAIAHDGAEMIGMLTGHVTGYDGVAAVSRVERREPHHPHRDVRELRAAYAATEGK